MLLESVETWEHFLGHRVSYLWANDEDAAKGNCKIEIPRLINRKLHNRIPVKMEDLLLC